MLTDPYCPPSLNLSQKIIDYNKKKRCGMHGMIAIDTFHHNRPKWYIH